MLKYFIFSQSHGSQADDAGPVRSNNAYQQMAHLSEIISKNFLMNCYFRLLAIENSNDRWVLARNLARASRSAG